VVSRNDEQWPAEATKERCGAFVLSPPSAVGEVARHGDQLGRGTLDQPLEAALDRGFLDAPGVQVGDVEEPHGQRRTTLLH
jgi:hypothetical protein